MTFFAMWCMRGGDHSVSGSAQIITADMQHFIQHVPVYRPRLFEARAEPSVYLLDCDFGLRVFSGVFEIPIAMDRAYRCALPPDC